ncbi:MAG: MerC domain-containing protein, partial [Halioglobus sp.]|nr:MerC domain-containing protein [Halioglobus sp.]
AMMPFVAEFAESHWHTPMLAIALPVSATAIVIGYRRNGNRALVATASAGMLLLVIGATLAHSYIGPTADRLFTVTGSLILATVHWQNSRQLRAHPARCNVAMAES